VAKTRRGILYTSAAVLSTTFILIWVGLTTPKPAPATAEVSVAPVVEMTVIKESPARDGATPQTAASPMQIAQRDPRAFLELAAQRCRTQVDDYRCVMIKKEFVDGKYTESQEIELRFRDEPRAIFMIWRKNADGCKRALYRDDPEYVDDDGKKLARVEPNGLARLLVADIMLPVDGPEAKKASRHPINRAGFKSFFDLLDRYTKLASDASVLDLRCAGTSEVDGRPTIVIERRLPNKTESDPYPDALLVMHFDRETLLPVAVYSYADGEGEKLLGSYVYTDVDLSPNFDAKAFKF
jgi:hypothetical protein